MKNHIVILGVLLIIASLFSSGCTDVLGQQKVGSFGDTGSVTPAMTTSPGTPGSSGISASSGSTIEQMRLGSIYKTCYSGCTNAKKKSVNDCDKACCLAQCQPRTPDDTKRCAAICGVELEKVTTI